MILAEYRLYEYYLVNCSYNLNNSATHSDSVIPKFLGFTFFVAFTIPIFYKLFSCLCHYLPTLDDRVFLKPDSLSSKFPSKISEII